MTSDAKVGLLLGLVFIFLIAFLINGLPNLRNNESNNELTISAVNTTNNGLGIADKQRKVSRQFIQQEIRFKALLPQNKPVLTAKSTNEIPKKPVNQTLTESLRKIAKKTAVTTKIEPVRKIKPVKPQLPKTYVVCDGDNLAIIAQKFYGSDAGNKKVNVMKIFEANSAILASPDEICVGQRLIIPPLTISNPNSNRDNYSSEAFNKLKSIDKTILTAQTKQNSPKIYIVKEDDSLWTIAEEQLGNGSRYSDISRMNTNIIHNEDNLVIGMRLKLPAR